MKGLLVKDYLMLSAQRRFILLALIMVIVISVSANNGSFVIGYCAFMGSLMGTNSISYDDYNHGYSFLMTLPFTRKEYVLEKFIFCLSCVVLFSVVGALIALVGQMMRGLNETYLMSFGLTYLILIWIAFLIAAIMLPVQLHFGSERARIAFAIVMLSLFVLVIGGIKLTERLPIQLDPIFSQLSLPLVVGVGIGILGVAFALSYSISLAIMQRKEF